MKKLLICFFAAFLNFAFADPVGNPLNPEIIDEGFFISQSSWLNFRIGYEGIFVSDARMIKKTSDGKIDNFKNDVNSGTLTLNLKNRVDCFGVLGASRVRADWRFDNSGDMARIELETNYKFYWAAGMKIILFQWGNTVFSAGGRYSCARPTISCITLDGVPQDSGDCRVRYKDWQADLGVAHKIDIFIPYLGVNFLNDKSEILNAAIVLENDSRNWIKMKNKDKFGVYVGCSLSNGKYFLLTFEARFINEDAISVVGEIKF